MFEHFSDQENDFNERCVRVLDKILASHRAKFVAHVTYDVTSGRGDIGEPWASTIAFTEIGSAVSLPTSACSVVTLGLLKHRT